ncbi:MAG: hypothetical protein P1P82_15375 [Bacteroidales bacterium]|nr:hypothetical protein [Bacteroidales bacterium]
MKNLPTLIAFVAMILVVSCSGKKETDVVYEYQEKTYELSDELQEKIGFWAEEGMSCYGILALVDQDGVIQEGSVIKARILRFNGDSVKMRSLESKQLREVEGCDQMGISRGETWWETEGDIYRTKVEAQARLDEALSKVSF